MTSSSKVEVYTVFRFLYINGKGVKDGTRLGLAYSRDDFCTKYFRSAIFSAYTKHGICYTVDFPLRMKHHVVTTCTYKSPTVTNSHYTLVKTPHAFQ